MNKHNMSLGEYCKRRNITEENVYTASKEDPTDWPKVYRHEDEIIVDIEYAKQRNYRQNSSRQLLYLRLRAIYN